MLAIFLTNIDPRGKASRQAFLLATGGPIVIYAIASAISFLFTDQRPIAYSHGLIWPLVPLFLVSLMVNAAYFVRRSRSIDKSVHWVWPFVTMWMMSAESVLFAVTATGWSLAWAQVYVSGDKNFGL